MLNQPAQLLSTINNMRAESEMLKKERAQDAAAMLSLAKQLHAEQEKVAKLRKVLESLRPSHTLVDEDNWYSCPLATYSDGTPGWSGPEDRAGKCRCNAGKVNAIIDAALKETGDVK